MEWICQSNEEKKIEFVVFSSPPSEKQRKKNFFFHVLAVFACRLLTHQARKHLMNYSKRERFFCHTSAEHWSGFFSCSSSLISIKVGSFWAIYFEGFFRLNLFKKSCKGICWGKSNAIKLNVDWEDNGRIIQQINREQINANGRTIDIMIIKYSPQSICSGNVSEQINIDKDFIDDSRMREYIPVFWDIQLKMINRRERKKNTRVEGNSSHIFWRCEIFSK